MSAFEDKGSSAYTSPAAVPGSYQQPQPAHYAQGQPQAPLGYAQQPQGYAPQPQLQTQLSAAQIGENFRGQLFAQCAQGIHQPTTKYGVFGIITAIVCFPCGLIALFIDVERKCDRCGIKL
ncbi:hypothetical protein DFH08DRAFT_882337 [Mycena albidolilacea]|uniref:Brain protein I3 n=1 Tax=Mycena albidolilacea TaxID=1033008 RepID=A0AAD6ZMW3_9AGAR|nr:hypothetical protein DFH08DRAFT_882337 [Mycena albidolilacea]